MNLFRTYIALSVLIFGTNLCGWAKSYMYVQLNSGDVIYYRLKESPTITYTDTELIVRAGSDINNQYLLSDVKNLMYATPATTLIDNDLTLTYPIWIYSISGQYITTLEQTIDLQNIPYGIYILRSQKSAKKVVLQ